MDCRTLRWAAITSLKPSTCLSKDCSMPTLKDALTDFLRVERSPQTTRHYRRFLAPFVDAIGPARDVRRVTFDDISDYFAAYRPRVRASTLCQYANVCKS